jgi:hypothetical protein
MPDYPANSPPVRILLFSDVHVHGPDMPPERVARIVGRINCFIRTSSSRRAISSATLWSAGTIRSRMPSRPSGV